jgi:hypothetical protein
MLRFLFFILLFLHGRATFAQVNFWHVSASAEKTINDVGIEKMQAAWFVTGHDTVYSYRFIGGKNIARKTPFDADTMWRANDSLYHEYKGGPQNVIHISVYFGNRLKRQTRSKNGKLSSEEHWQHDSLGREIYHREWSPYQTKTTIKHSQIYTEYIFDNAQNASITYRKQHGDTNRVWSLQGLDTTSHRFHWGNYMEEKRYKPFFINRQWHDGGSQIQVVRTIDFADSSIIVTREDEREMWSYNIPENQDRYGLYQYTKVIGLKTLRSTYVLKPQSDTARHTWETYGKLAYGNRKLQELRLDKDSSRYRQIDYYWKENGEIDYLKITNRWGVKRKKSVDWNRQFQEPIGCGMNVPYVHPEIRQVDYRVYVNDENLKGIRWNGKPLENIIRQKLAVNEEHLDWQDLARWNETLVFELDETGKVGMIRRGPNSEVEPSVLKKALGEIPIELPPETKTVFFYTDAKGKKHQKQMSYILLPVEVIIEGN